MELYATAELLIQKFVRSLSNGHIETLIYLEASVRLIKIKRIFF